MFKESDLNCGNDIHWPVDNHAEGMTLTVEVITPQMAENWLDKNYSDNRKLRPATVKNYSRAMKNGEWRLTHEAIAFSGRGHLINGQHRLSAIIDADIPIKMTVIRGVPLDSYAHIDQGAKRTPSDVFGQVGIEAGKFVTSNTVASILKYLHYGAHSHSARGVSNTELISLYKKHEALFRWWNYVAPSGRPTGVITGPSVAAFFRAWYREDDKDRLAQAVRVFISGYPEDKTDETIIALRESLRNNLISNNNSPGRLAMFLKCQNAIEQYMRGRIMRSIKAKKLEQYPAPLLAADGSIWTDR